MKKLVLVFIAAYCALFALAMGCVTSPLEVAFDKVQAAKATLAASKIHYDFMATPTGSAGATIGAHAPEK